MFGFVFPFLRCHRWLLLIIAGVFLNGCHKTATVQKPVPAKGSRHLGAHLSQPVSGSYADAYRQARTAGIDCVPFTLQWTVVEQNGYYDSAGLLTALNGFYAGQPVSLSVCVSPFAADRRDMPADLINTAFDDPAMIARFNKLLDSIHSRVSGVGLRYLIVGNEVDLYLSSHPAEWSAYAGFCRAVRLHAKSLWGNGLTVGAETTLGGTIGNAQKQVQSLDSSMDILCLTYYPLKANFFMLPSDQAVEDFASLFDLYPAAPVLFQECGYATGAVCGGSDSAQANFVRTIFQLWDQRSPQITYIAFLWLNDLTAAQAGQVTSDYGLTGTPAAAAFTDYVRTLGLCDSTGNSKQGFNALKQEALSRGWTN